MLAGEARHLLEAGDVEARSRAASAPAPGPRGSSRASLGTSMPSPTRRRSPASCSRRATLSRQAAIGLQALGQRRQLDARRGPRLGRRERGGLLGLLLLGREDRPRGRRGPPCPQWRRTRPASRRPASAASSTASGPRPDRRSSQLLARHAGAKGLLPMEAARGAGPRRRASAPSPEGRDVDRGLAAHRRGAQGRAFNRDARASSRSTEPRGQVAARPRPLGRASSTRTQATCARVRSAGRTRAGGAAGLPERRFGRPRVEHPRAADGRAGEYDRTTSRSPRTATAGPLQAELGEARAPRRRAAVPPAGARGPAPRRSPGGCAPGPGPRAAARPGAG